MSQWIFIKVSTLCASSTLSFSTQTSRSKRSNLIHLQMPSSRRLTLPNSGNAKETLPFPNHSHIMDFMEMVQLVLLPYEMVIHRADIHMALQEESHTLEEEVNHPRHPYLELMALRHVQVQRVWCISSRSWSMLNILQPCCHVDISLLLSSFKLLPRRWMVVFDSLHRLSSDVVWWCQSLYCLWFSIQARF